MVYRERPRVNGDQSLVTGLYYRCKFSPFLLELLQSGQKKGKEIKDFVVFLTTFWTFPRFISCSLYKVQLKRRHLLVTQTVSYSIGCKKIQFLVCQFLQNYLFNLISSRFYMYTS